MGGNLNRYTISATGKCRDHNVNLSSTGYRFIISNFNNLEDLILEKTFFFDNTISVTKRIGQNSWAEAISCEEVTKIIKPIILHLNLRQVLCIWIWRDKFNIWNVSADTPVCMYTVHYAISTLYIFSCSLMHKIRLLPLWMYMLMIRHPARTLEYDHINLGRRALLARYLAHTFVTYPHMLHNTTQLTYLHVIHMCALVTASFK